jgi:sialate O-acetylesterase
MPFGIISQCTEGDPQDRDDYLEKMLNEGIYIREVHFKTFVDFQKAGDKNVGYASSYDQRRAWYHPQIKIPVGERIAQWALATQYGLARQVRWLPPTLKDVKCEGATIRLQFDSTVGPFHDGPMVGFAIAGADGRFQLAKAEWAASVKEPKQPDRTAIVLSSPLIAEPKYFRYAWGRNPMANVKSTDHSDLPLPTLRNDPFTIADMYAIYTGKKPTDPKVLDNKERGELLRALQADDLKRRLAEAKALIEANPGR